MENMMPAWANTLEFVLHAVVYCIPEASIVVAERGYSEMS